MASNEVERLHDMIDDQDAEIRDLHRKIDALLAHCPDGECYECGAIICPHKEPLHFHHDGCPACCQDEDEQHG